mmetsp:Transcript_22862/g.71147  ORF Transcript_22862/g.71147 Transcript_22862/m.71147 type:complete len:202 (+) Transcript_22862:282-887(+)
MRAGSWPLPTQRASRPCSATSGSSTRLRSGRCWPSRATTWSSVTLRTAQRLSRKPTVVPSGTLAATQSIPRPWWQGRRDWRCTRPSPRASRAMLSRPGAAAWRAGPGSGRCCAWGARSCSRWRRAGVAAPAAWQPVWPRRWSAPATGGLPSAACTWTSRAWSARSSCGTRAPSRAPPEQPGRGPASRATRGRLASSWQQQR